LRRLRNVFNLPVEDGMKMLHRYLTQPHYRRGGGDAGAGAGVIRHLDGGASGRESHLPGAQSTVKPDKRRAGPGPFGLTQMFNDLTAAR